MYGNCERAKSDVLFCWVARTPTLNNDAMLGALANRDVNRLMKEVNNTTPHNASQYDEVIRDTIPFYDYFLSETIDLVRSTKPDVEVWLDTGCGTGALVAKAAPLFPDTLFLLSDPSEDMLIQARCCLDSFPDAQIRFLSAVGTENIPLDIVESPQVITAIQSHHYLSKVMREAATQRCFDLLSPGGIYITFENIHPNSKSGIEIGLARWKRYQISKGRDEETVQEHGKRFNKAYFPIRVHEHLRLLRRCGFDVAELFWFSHLQAGFYAIK